MELPPRRRNEIIKGLNEDLAREDKAIIQYVVFSVALKGAEYNDIAYQLKQHASQELAHALEVARQIDYLGGNPTVTGKQAEFSNDSKKMLEIDLKTNRTRSRITARGFEKPRPQGSTRSPKRSERSSRRNKTTRSI